MQWRRQSVGVFSVSFRPSALVFSWRFCPLPAVLIWGLVATHLQSVVRIAGFFLFDLQEAQCSMMNTAVERPPFPSHSSQSVFLSSATSSAALHRFLTVRMLRGTPWLTPRAVTPAVGWPVASRILRSIEWAKGVIRGDENSDIALYRSLCP